MEERPCARCYKNAVEERRDALAVTAQLGVLLGKLHADLFGVVRVEGKAVHLLHGGLSGGDADEEDEANRHAVFVVPWGMLQ